MIIDLDEREFDALVADVLKLCNAYDRNTTVIVQDFLAGNSSVSQCAAMLKEANADLNKKFNESIRKHCHVAAVNAEVKRNLLEELPELCDSVVKARHGNVGSILSQNENGNVIFSFMEKDEISPSSLLKLFQTSPSFNTEAKDRFLHDERTIEAYRADCETYPSRNSAAESEFLDEFMLQWNQSEYEKILLERLARNKFPNFSSAHTLPHRLIQDLFYSPQTHKTPRLSSRIDLPDRLVHDFLHAAKDHPKEFAEFLKVNPISSFWEAHNGELNEKTYDQIVQENAFAHEPAGLCEVDLQFLKDVHPEVYRARCDLEAFDEISKMIEDYPPYKTSLPGKKPEKYAAYKKIALSMPEKSPKDPMFLTKAEVRCMEKYEPKFLDEYLTKTFQKQLDEGHFFLGVDSAEAAYMKEHHRELCGQYFVQKYVGLIQKFGLEGITLPDLRAFNSEMYAETLLQYFKAEANTGNFPTIHKTAFECMQEFKKDELDKILCEKFKHISQTGEKVQVSQLETEFMQENHPSIFKAYKNRLSNNSASGMMKFYHSWKPQMEYLSQVFCEIDRESKTYKNSKLNFFALTPFKRPEEAREVLGTLMKMAKHLDDKEAYDSFSKLNKAIPRRFTNFSWVGENAAHSYGNTTYKFYENGELVEVQFDEKIYKIADDFLRENHIPRCVSAYTEIFRPLAQGKLNQFLCPPLETAEQVGFDEIDKIEEVEAEIAKQTAENLKNSAEKTSKKD